MRLWLERVRKITKKSIISGGLGLLGGLFKKKNNGLKNQQKLMQQAWEYEKQLQNEKR